jgi:photosystem II stability/assembly factor-like uncharacterized protein
MKARISYFILCFLLVAKSLTAQPFTWEPVNMPRAGTVESLLAFDSTLFVSSGYSSNGAYRSTDLGNSWSQPFATPYFNAFARNGSDLYGGGYNGLYKSTDNGRKWKFVNSIFRYAEVNAIAITGQSIVTATRDSGIIFSTNTGVSWNRASKQPASNALISLGISGSTYFVGTESDGIYQSSDSGLTWTLSGITLRHSKIIAITVNTSFVFCATEQGIYRSSDIGKSWSLIGLQDKDISALTATSNSLFVGLTNGGILRSQDNGITWDNVGLPNSRVTSFSVNGDLVVAGTLYDGVFKCSDNGNTWVHCGFELVVPRLIRFSDNGTIYIGADYNGIYRSSDNCKSWEWLPNGIITSAENRLRINDITLTGSSILVGTEKGLFTSKDGQQWVEDTGVFFNQNIEALAAENNEVLAAVNGIGVLHSFDAGISWNTVHSKLNRLWFDLRMLYKAGDAILLLCDSQFAISRDNGKSWDENFARNTRAIGFGNKKNILLLGDYYYEVGNDMSPLYGGLYRSNNSGQTWDFRGFGYTSSVNDFTSTETMSFVALGSYYYLPGASGVYFSNDDGVTWDSAGLNDRGVSFVYSNKNTVYAISDSVFRTTHGVNAVRETFDGELSILRNTNPVTNRLSLYYTVSTSSAVSIEVVSIFGNTILKTTDRSSIIGEREIALDLSAILSGTYILKLRSNGQTVVRKIIKL